MRFPKGVMPQLWLAGLRDVPRPGSSNLKQWLESGKGYAVTGVTANSTVEILIHREPEFLVPISFEVNLWASSAFETLESIPRQAIRVQSIAWPLIQLYYASFFSAHCLLRTMGRICTQLNSSHVSALRRSSRAVGLNTSIDEGFYEFQYDRSLQLLRGTKMRDSHADTWASFNHLVTELSTRVLTIALAKNSRIEAADCLIKLGNILQSNGSSRGNWLSQFRNLVNYQKQYGVWYPYNKNNPSIAELSKSISRWKKDSSEFNLDSTSSEILKFLEASTFIAYLCRRAIVEFSITRPSQHHFVDLGGLDFLAFAKAIKG